MSVRPDLHAIHNPPDVEGVARVIGGVGGIRFQWEELDVGARTIGRAAEELGEVAEAVGWMTVRLTALRPIPAHSGAGSGVSHALGVGTTEAINVVWHQLLDHVSELRGTGDRIERSRFAYEAADGAVRHFLGDVRTAFGSLQPMPHAGPQLTLEHARTESIHLDGTVDNLLEQVEHATAVPGNAFEVLEVQGESGPTYVVILPGSEGRRWVDPFSFYGIAEASIGNSEYVHNAVGRALDDVGAEENANVVLVGYSQGGMHAMNLANSGPLRERYSIDLVVTAGSPIEREEAPQEATFLHLVHTWDVVPHADLIPHEDRANQVSVILDHEALLNEGEDFGLGPAHKIDSYRQGAQAVDLSSHPSIAPVTAALGAAVAGGTAARHIFQVTRPPLIGPQPPPGKHAGERRARVGLPPGSGESARNK